MAFKKLLQESKNMINYVTYQESIIWVYEKVQKYFDWCLFYGIGS